MPASLQREDGDYPIYPWKTLPLTVCQNLCFYANVTPTAPGAAGGFWNVLGPSRIHRKSTVSGMIRGNSTDSQLKSTIFVSVVQGDNWVAWHIRQKLALSALSIRCKRPIKENMTRSSIQANVCVQFHSIFRVFSKDKAWKRNTKQRLETTQVNNWSKKKTKKKKQPKFKKDQLLWSIPEARQLSPQSTCRSSLSPRACPSTASASTWTPSSRRRRSAPRSRSHRALSSRRSCTSGAPLGWGRQCGAWTCAACSGRSWGPGSGPRGGEAASRGRRRACRTRSRGDGRRTLAGPVEGTRSGHAPEINIRESVNNEEECHEQKEEKQPFVLERR